MKLSDDTIIEESNSDNSELTEYEYQRKRFDSYKGKRNNRIMGIEERLNLLVDTDIQNPEIYELLKKLAAIYINTNKYSYGYHNIDEVCHDVAADLWVQLIAGKRVHAWIYYIGKMIKYSYVIKQRKIEHEIIDVGDNVALEEGIKRMSTASFTSCINDFDTLNRKIMLDNIDGIVCDTMKYSKFKKGTKEYSLVFMNLCINVVRDFDKDPPIYFRIDNSLKPYVNIALAQYKKLFLNSGFTSSIMDGVREDLELRLIADESAMSAIMNRRA